MAARQCSGHYNSESECVEPIREDETRVLDEQAGRTAGYPLADCVAPCLSPLRKATIKRAAAEIRSGRAGALEI